MVDLGGEDEVLEHGLLGHDWLGSLALGDVADNALDAGDGDDGLAIGLLGAAGGGHEADLVLGDARVREGAAVLDQLPLGAVAAGTGVDDSRQLLVVLVGADTAERLLVAAG